MLKHVESEGRAAAEGYPGQASPGTGRGFPDEEMGAELRRLAWQRQVGKCGSREDPPPTRSLAGGAGRHSAFEGSKAFQSWRGELGRVKKALV